jgi:hypothetical protein
MTMLLGDFEAKKNGAFHRVVLLPDGDRFVTGSEDMAVHVHSTADGA